MCELSEHCSEAEERLSRLIGDPERAREKAQRLRALMDRMDERDCDAEVEILKATADPCRLRILKLLMTGELCVCEIMTALDRPQSSVSHHLAILREAGLIKERKVGKWSHFRISEVAVIEMINLAGLLRETANGGPSRPEGLQSSLEEVRYV
ncbi:MAG: winged helix-turn-helix transcriptional regulator [Methanotrichaceae archaeon]|nr:winged helix-turn-helix transcriptional regulator [Methanotrichaceae archaeon]